MSRPRPLHPPAFNPRYSRSYIDPYAAAKNATLLPGTVQAAVDLPNTLAGLVARRFAPQSEFVQNIDAWNAQGAQIVTEYIAPA